MEPIVGRAGIHLEFLGPFSITNWISKNNRYIRLILVIFFSRRKMMTTEELQNRTQPLLMAHRGIPWYWPENSLLSFRKALDSGADILEFDVHLTKDQVPIVIHDYTLDRTTNGTGSVSSYTLEKLKTFEVIYTKSGNCTHSDQIPTLTETLELLVEYPKVMINCEIKDYSDVCTDLIIDAFESAGILDQTVFTCFDYNVLSRIKKTNPALKVQGFPLELMSGVSYEERNPELLFDYIGIKYSLLNQELISKYRSLGIITGAWVINDVADLQQCYQLGVSIVTTDRLDLMLLARKNLLKLDLPQEG